MRLRRRRPAEARPDAPRLLVPFSGGRLDPAVLEAALRIARADGAVFVPAYLIMVPLMRSRSTRRWAARSRWRCPCSRRSSCTPSSEGVPVDARLERGRSLRDALRRLWEVEQLRPHPGPVVTRRAHRVRRARHRLDPDEHPHRDARAAAGVRHRRCEHVAA